MTRMARSSDETEQAALRTGLNDRSAVLTRLILAPTFAHSWVVGGLQHLETIMPWTRFIVPA
jgi:hypothetical protein